jgi:hypothetical protein
MTQPNTPDARDGLEPRVNRNVRTIEMNSR